MALKREASVTGKLMSACESFAGLPDGAETRFSLIRMAERAGRHYGLSFADLRLLTLYVSFTRAEDWEEGGRPIYTRPVYRTASDLGISARQVNRSERKLESLGLLMRDTRADGGRGFVRGYSEEGDTVAYCVDLRPLAVAWVDLVKSAEAVRAREEAIDAARAAISRALRIVPQLLSDALALDETRALAEGLPTQWSELPQRTPRHRDLPRLVDLQTIMSDLVERLRAFLSSSIPTNESDASAKTVSHIYNTKPDSESCNQRSGANAPVSQASSPPGSRPALENKAREAQPENKTIIPPDRNNLTALFGLDIGDEAQVESGLDRLRITQVRTAMPETWRFELEGFGQFSWRAYCMIAEGRLGHLGVGNHAWKRLCLVIGRRAAAVALMALECNRTHPTKPVRNVGGAVFRFADIAKTGNLRLDAMVLGILARNEESADA